MQPRGQQFDPRTGNAETPRQMARRAFAELDTCVDACPNCGATGGEPVQIGSGETSRETGYCDEATGCTLCAGRVKGEQSPAIRPAEEDGDVWF